MLVEQRTYTFKPGTVPLFLEIYQERALALQTEVLGNLLGYFWTEIGPLNQTVHMWGYSSFEERQRRRAALMEHAEWRDFLKEVSPMILSQETKLLNPAPFSPIR